MSSKLYDKLKFVAQVLLPALGTLYVALAAIWGLPNPEAVSGTVLAVDTALVTLLHISSVSENGPAVGTIEVHEHEQGTKFSLELEGDPEKELKTRDRAVFKVKKKK